MLKTYIKGTHKRLPLLSLLKLNFFLFILTFLFFFILPLVLRKYCIIGNKSANIIKCIFLILFELNTIIVAIAINTLKIKASEAFKRSSFFKQIKGKILNIVIYTGVKASLLILFVYTFRVATKLNLHISFLVIFFYFFSIFVLFWLPTIISTEKVIFFKALFKSVCLFALHPFFTLFVFFHIIFLSVFSFCLFNLYPGISCILFNMYVGYGILKGEPYA